MKVSISSGFLTGIVVATATAAAFAQTPLTTVRVATGLTRPVFASSPPGDEDRLFVLEENSGSVKVLKDGGILPMPFITVPGMSTAGEQGLLGMAFHPSYATNGYFYLNFTRPRSGGGGNETAVMRYTVSAASPDVADLSSAFEILKFNQTASNHNAGWMGFGPNDGYLYIATGDGGSSNDPSCNAQNRENLLGKMLRIDVDGGSPYAIPPTNPLIAFPALRHEIWSYGLRNPWRCGFDRGTGDLYVGDVGQSPPAGREEVCFEAAGGAGGINYGWKLVQGSNCYQTNNCVNPPACPNTSVFTLPIHEFNTGGGNCSVIGGYVYRGCAIPDLVGTYFFGDHCARKVWSFEFDGTTMTNFQDRTAELAPPAGQGSIGQITSFAENGRGEMFVLDLDGDVFQIVPDVTPVATDLGFGKIGSNGMTPLFEVCGLLGAGETAEAIMRRGPASTTAAFLISATASPVTFPWGTIVPGAPILAIPFPVDANGRVQFTLTGGIGPATVVAQWAILDAGATAGIGLSNGLQIDYP